jgi:predicted nucleic acid-binding protein
MILADTSIWIDHLDKGDQAMQKCLADNNVLTHPFVIGELAMGNLNPRNAILKMLGRLPQSAIASNSEVLQFVAREKLHGLGIGYIDAHLLAAARLTANARLWSRDKRLRSAAERLGLDFKG